MTAGRKKIETSVATSRVGDKAAIDGELLHADLVAIDAHREGRAEALARTTALAKTLHYDGPLDEASLETGILDIKRRIEGDLFEFGRRLLLLREFLPHGEFQPTLERLGIEPRAAQRCMQVTLKFAQTPAFARLGVGKLLELTLLDDEEIGALAEGGSARGITVDALDRMSLRELKARVREQAAQIDAKDTVAKQTAESMQELREMIAGRPPVSLAFAQEEALQALSKQALVCVANITAGLRSCITSLLDGPGGFDEPIARQAVAAALGQVAAATRALSEDYSILPQGAEVVDAEGAEDAAIWAAVNADLAKQTPAAAEAPAEPRRPDRRLRPVRGADDGHAGA